MTFTVSADTPFCTSMAAGIAAPIERNGIDVVGVTCASFGFAFGFDKAPAGSATAIAIANTARIASSRSIVTPLPLLWHTKPVARPDPRKSTRWVDCGAVARKLPNQPTQESPCI